MGYVSRSLRDAVINVCIIAIGLSDGFATGEVIGSRVPTATCARVVAFKGRISRTFVIFGFVGNFNNAINEIVISGSRIRFRVYFLTRC